MTSLKSGVKMILMNKFKFDFNYIKKNLNQKNFLKDIYVLEKDSNKVSGDKYGGGDMFYKVIKHSFDGDDNAYGILLDDYCDKKENKKFKLTINRCQFDGTLLPKLNSNFKLESYFDFGCESHSLISSKTDKFFFYIFSERYSYYKENQSVYAKHDTCDNYVKNKFKKKLNNYQFFEHIIKTDKKSGSFKMIMDTDHPYTSTNGINYYELYKKGKSTFLKLTAKKINKTPDFDDLIVNLDLQKFIKFLDKQCKYKFKISPLPWMHKKFPDIFHDLVSSSLSKNMTHKKLLNSIYKNEGDFIHAAIQNGTLLKHTDSNFKLERSIYIRFDDGESWVNDYFDYQIISSKINKSYYILVYHTSPGVPHEDIYFCKKKLKDRSLAIKFVKEEHKKLKKYHKIRGYSLV